MERVLSRSEASEAVAGHGWRFVLGTLRTSVAVDSLVQATTAATRAVQACGAHADEHLRLDLRPDRVLLTLWTPVAVTVTDRDADLACRISAALHELGLVATAETGASLRSSEPASVQQAVLEAGHGTEETNGAGGAPDVPGDSSAGAPPGTAGPGIVSESSAGEVVPAQRSVQELEVAIDAVDIVAVRPFWKAVLGYTNEFGKNGPEDRIVDPFRQGPAIWFQRMTEPRRQRNRIHLDVSVPHDEARARIAAALVAGGRLVAADRAPAFWVLADCEGNEVCVTTWQGRDP